MSPKANKSSRVSPERLRALWPDIWDLIRPRRVRLLFGFALVVINRAASLALPASVKFLIDDVIGKNQPQLVWPLTLAVLAATTVQGVSSYGLAHLLTKEAQRLINELRAKLQVHVGRLPISYFDKNRTGALVSRIVNDVEGLRVLLGSGIVEFIGGLLTALFALVVMFRISATITMVALAIIAVFALFLNRWLNRMRPLFRERSRIIGEVLGRLTESVAGIRVVKGYGCEEFESTVFKEGLVRLFDNNTKTIAGIAITGLSTKVTIGVVGATVMLLGAREILAGTLTLGEFAMLTAFLAFINAPINQVVSVGTQFTEAFAGLERTREVMREEPEDVDPRRTTELPANLRGEVEVDGVTFAYEPGAPVLHGITFASAPNTVTALVGGSGSGKSTIIGLIAAFYNPDKGQVRVDGVDLASVRLKSYRTQLGVVFQESFLFDGTIRQNIAYARPNAAMEEVVAASRIACVEEFVQALEKGYDTMIGERGVKLSGGQRQRISIARAILADPRILILDEATSSLDSESEALIQQGLDYLMKGRTTFVIAHRLSTIRRADQVLVIEAGRIVERGNHESLYEARGRYYDLYIRQHGLASNLFVDSANTLHRRAVEDTDDDELLADAKAPNL